MASLSLHTVTVRLARVAPATPGVASTEFTVEGDLESEDGRRAAFNGWVGLVNELERLVTEEV